MLAAAVATTACSGISFENDNQVEGVYTLRSVNSRPLPLDLDDRAEAINLSSATLTLSANGEWTEALTGSATQDGQPVQKVLLESGRWSLRAPYVELQRSDGAISFSGVFSSLSGPKLELQRPVRSRANLYVYAR